MPDHAQPISLSVYRGQSRSGMGEGPGRTVLQGEQYLLVDPRLYHDEILDPIRPWMTLDSDPADHQRLNDKLEAWSLFSAGDYLFVVRLVSAGVYDRRAAYFAHGRAWKADGLPRGYDPGLHLGRSEAFDPPWRDSGAAAEMSESMPTLVRPAQVGAETATATLFLGHLLQAIVDGQPLIIAAPIGDFASGSPLHPLISFARGALPADLRRQCRIRVYSRFPELFLRHLETNLVVIPEDAASTALNARPAATLLDRQGHKLAGRDLRQPAHEYAAAVLERAIAIPEGLSYFSERFRHEPSAEDTRAIQITYNLAFALAGPPDRRGEFLRKYLPRAAEKLSGDVDWNRLIANEDWSDFPAEALMDQLLTDSPDLSRARRGLLRAIEGEASRRGIVVDERLTGWWSTDDSSKSQRLAELLAHDPPLVSPDAAVPLTLDVPLDRLSGTGFLHSILEAEARSGLLGRRTHESADLSRASSDPRIFRILRNAVLEGQLEPEWARVLIRTAPREALIRAAEEWLGNLPFFREAWGDVPELLLDRLRSLDPPPTTLASLVKNAARSIEPLDCPQVYVRLADLLTRIDRAEGEPLMRSLRSALPALTASERQDLEGVASEKEGSFTEIERLDLKALLDLCASLQKQESHERIYEELDHRMLRFPETTTEELVRRGWWYFWRCRSRLTSGNVADAEVLRRSAFSWLCSEAWTEPEHEATLEAWNQVVADLPGVLTGEDLARMHGTDGRHRWPWIPPFEEEQLDDLIRRIEDLGALAELTDAVGSDEWGLAMPFHEYVLSTSPFREKLPASAFAWLLDRQDGHPAEIPSIEQSTYLCNHVRHRAGRAFQSRIESVANHLDHDASEALRIADHPNLWRDAMFLSKVADWMNRKVSLQAVGIVNARSIDEHVQGKPAFFPQSPSQALMRELTQQGFYSAARLLSPQIPPAIQQEILADETIHALLESRVDDSCWQRLAKEVQSAEPLHADRHPLTVVAARIRDTLSRDQRRGLAQTGWETLRAAAAANPALMAPLMSPPAEEATVLPLLNLVSTMLGAGTLGIAAARLASEVTNSAWREGPWLRQGLRLAIGDFKRHGQVSSADDRQETALALLVHSHDGPAEEQALDRVPRHAAASRQDGSREFGDSTMNDIATFFRHRANDPGETYQMQIGSLSVSVYSRKPIQSGLTRARQAQGTERALEDLRVSVATEGGGGFIVSAIDEGGVRSLTVTRIDARNFEPVDQFVLLSPGRMARFHPADGKNHKVPLGSHTIVPVDPQAMNELELFIGHLSWLSPDLESLVLNAIRRPNLETRLNKVESPTFGQNADEATEFDSRERSEAAREGWMSPAAFRVATVVLLVLLLGMNAILVSRIPAKGEPTDTSATPSTTSLATDATATVADSARVPNISEDMYVDEAHALLRTLHEKRSAPLFADLYKNHFEKFYKEPLTSEEVKVLFQQCTDPKKIEANRPLLWGIIKLQALKLNPSPNDKNFLTSWQEWTTTKEALGRIEAKIEKDPAGKRLLAAFACRLGYDTPYMPRLPETAPPPNVSQQTTPYAALEFERGGDCNTFTAADIKAGLQDLTKFVEEQQ